MFLVVQFPFVDPRPYLSGGQGKLTKPDWPLPTVSGSRSQFVRSFGPARERTQDPDAAWLDEDRFCSADHALKIPPSRAARKPRLVFRRLFHDGESVARLEVGFMPARIPPQNLSADDLAHVIDDMLQLPVQVRAPHADRLNTPLILASRPLAHLFQHATTSRKPSLATPPPSAAPPVADGAPMVLLELDPAENIEIPDVFTTLSPSPIAGASVSFGIQRVIADVKVWVIQRTRHSRIATRGLRLCLLRLHAEQEALDSVLKMMARGELPFDPGTPQGELLQEYLNRATRLINRTQWHGVDQSAILAAFDAVATVTRPAVKGLLSQSLDRARTQVARKVQAFHDRQQAEYTAHRVIVQPGGSYMTNYGVIVKDNAQVQQLANFAGAQNIQLSNCFNTFAASNPAKELKEAVAELHAQTKKLLEQIPTKVADAAKAKEAIEEAKNSTEFITQQAEKHAKGESILKKQLTITKEGLVEAAKTCAELVAPVSAAVLGVLKLMGVA
jgi:hypothetical protein